MAENTKIEWADHTFNPWVGCTKVSSACDNCYAEGWAKRTGQPGLWAGDRRRTSDANWRLPYKWNNAAPLNGPRPRVFCASLADVFDNQVDPLWRTMLFAMIRETPNLDWLLLTKRPQNIRKMLPPDWRHSGPYPNVWLGTTCENQEEADRRIPWLLLTTAETRFLSCEPLLGPINLNRIGARAVGLGEIDALDHEEAPGIDWVIAGGESGPGARPMHPDWARSLRDQCSDAMIPFFFKQWGDWHPFDQILEPLVVADGSPVRNYEPAALDGVILHRVGKKRAGRLLDGVQHNRYPMGAANV